MNTTPAGTQKIIDKIAGQPASNIQAEHNPQAPPARNGYHILFNGSPVKDAHDRYTTQDASALLQRMENYPGPVILATNKTVDTDPHFLSLFNTVVSHLNPGA